ncbi:MAG: cyclic pyranopterin monophosphate synthase MoaC [Pseudomonadota bacterium]
MTKADPTQSSKLTHIKADGAATMVDIGGKQETQRQAIARGFVTASPDTISAIANGDVKKGDVLGTARIAGIMAAKQTHTLIPLCHPLAISKADIDIEVNERESRVEVTASVSVTGKTGVEMEALTAVSVACLTIYDMAKALQKDMVIGPIQLVQKTGGKSGDFRADAVNTAS